MAAEEMEPTASDRLREQGNEHYRNAARDWLAPAVQINRLQEAQGFYRKALDAATHDVERSSAYKNMAMVNWKLARACIKGTAAGSSSITFYFKEALKNFQDSTETGKCRDLFWQESLLMLALDCWSDVHKSLEGWDYDDRIDVLEKLVPFVPDNRTQAREYLEIAQNYFHWSVVSLSSRQFQHCLVLLGKAHFPLQEARRLGRHNNQLVQECSVLEEDIHIQHCVASSIQSRVCGEGMLLDLLEEEDLNMDAVWNVVDKLKEAALLTRERDLELEAMALSALGKVYDGVLKDKERAKQCLIKAIELANSMVPRTFYGHEWFDFARRTVEGYQNEQRMKEMQEYEKKRAARLLLIKDEMAVLKAKKEKLSKAEFLKFVYATHPPKNPQHTLAEIPAQPEWTALKKLYQKAVVHYHPDKMQEEEHGVKWKTLTEEITKMLTQTYEYYKGCVPEPEMQTVKEEPKSGSDSGTGLGSESEAGSGSEETETDETKTKESETQIKETDTEMEEMETKGSETETKELETETKETEEVETVSL